MYILLCNSIILGIVINLIHFFCFCDYSKTDFITQQTDIQIKESTG